MIDHWKPLGGFIENTIRPLIDQMKWFFDECDKREIPLSGENVKIMADYIVKCWIYGLLIKLVQNVMIAVIVGYFICTISL